MKITKLDNGKYKVDGRPQGTTGKRVIRTFDQKREAVAFVKYLHKQVEDGRPWQAKRQDSRTLYELGQRWHELHGQTLKAGKKRLPIIEAASNALGVPAEKITSRQYTEYRNRRLEAGTHPKTLNNELGFINAVYNKLNQLDEIKYANPLGKVKPLRIDERELSWLTLEQIGELLSKTDESPNPHTSMITKVCLNIGARWGEAERLKPQHLKADAITLTGTKSGKNRTIPISEDFAEELAAHFKAHGRMQTAMKAFRIALAKTDIQLPSGQASHVLRHTFAAHFMMGGGNILTLQKILGHQSVTMTMRYAHLSPEHLKEAVRLSPMAKLGKSGKIVEIKTGASMA